MKHEMSNQQYLLMVTLLGIELSEKDKYFVDNVITSNPPVVPRSTENNTLKEFQLAMTHNYRACIAMQGDNPCWRKKGDEQILGTIFRTIDDYLTVYPLAK